MIGIVRAVGGSVTGPAYRHQGRRQGQLGKRVANGTVDCEARPPTIGARPSRPRGLHGRESDLLTIRPASKGPGAVCPHDAASARSALPRRFASVKCGRALQEGPARPTVLRPGSAVAPPCSVFLRGMLSVSHRITSTATSALLRAESADRVIYLSGPRPATRTHHFSRSQRRGSVPISQLHPGRPSPRCMPWLPLATADRVRAQHISD